MRETTVLLLMVLVLAWPIFSWGGNGPFCSTYCNGRNCNNQATTSCQRCNTNWVATTNGSCNPNSLTNYYIAATTSDIGSGLTVSPVATTAGVCDTYNVYGWVTSGSTLTVTNPTGIIPSFFSMTIYFAVLTPDSGSGGNYWKSSTAITLTASDASGALNVPTLYPLYGSTRSRSSQFCYSNSRSQSWNKVSQTYTFGVSASALTFVIGTNQTANTTAIWGLSQFILIYRGCNWACQICFGPSVSQCNSCLMNATLTIWLSGTTCNQTCLTGYGYSTNISFCILCDPHCSVCFETNTNCTACTTYGTYIAYWYSANNSCLNPCPEGFFMNKTAQSCDPCNTNCTGCINTANRCTACVTYWGWYLYTCYEPCPIGTYNNTNLTNCTACYQYCEVCIGPSTLCTICMTTGPYVSYLLNTTNATGACVRTCPQGNYSATISGQNLCLNCDPACYYCTNNPSPCQQCVPGYYLYNSACINPCPNSTFASNATGTGQCLDCNVVCVTLSINMYFATPLNNIMYIDMQFSQALNFTSFNYKTFQTISISSSNQYYSLDMFSVTYKMLSTSSYRIILQPIGYIFLYNATFTVLTEAAPNATDYSLLFMPFKPSCYLQTASLSWFLIQGPPFNSLEVNLMTSFSTLSSKTNDFLDLPYVQQIKKSGVFNMLFSGAQITSCSILSNQIQSQNLYEGVRFWAIFVFFDAPPYERISNQTKTFVSPSVESQIRNALAVDLLGQDNDSQPRSLFSTDTMYWRFQRTGQTSFFIYDCYLPAFLIGLCWIGLIVVYCGRKKKWYTLHAAKVYSAVHKIHQISIIYVTMAAIVEFIYFQPTSAERFLSAIICVVFNVYFILYELYIYYDMLKYPMAEIGNRIYDYYVIRYGSFLKNVRYEQYDINEEWSPKHWFRPYNYHFLSYYKKFVMMICLPLFYSTTYAQMTILFIVQLLEIFRFWKVWPFLSTRRNYLRLSLQIALAFFFLINIIQIYLLVKIQSGNINEMGSTITIFYSLGWAGFILVFYFNITHIVIGLYDLCVGLRTSNRLKMDNARKKYYYSKIKQYQKDNESASKDLVNRWVKQGNLNNQYFGELPEINVRIEQYTMRMLLGKFQVTVRKITSLRMLKQRNHRKKNNTVTSAKIQKKSVIQQHKNPDLYATLHAYFESKTSVHIETVVLKTFINVFQPDFSEDEEVPMDRSNMFQRVELISFDNEKQEENLASLLEGFPLPAQWFDNL